MFIEANGYAFRGSNCYFQFAPFQGCSTLEFASLRAFWLHKYIGVGRVGGEAGGQAPPPNNLRGGQHTLWPPNNPPTFSFNFYVQQGTKLKGKIIINVTLI